MLLWDSIRDFVILGLLLLISLMVLVGVNQNELYGLRSLALNLTSRIESSFSWVGRYVNALDENDVLRNNNIQLSSQLARLREVEIENKRLHNLLAFKDSTNYQIIASKIVSKDITKRKNFFTLNVGKQQGVAVGMPVIDDNGLLGKVILVSENFAQVQPYLNTDFKIAAKLDSTQTWGVVSWQGTRSDRLIMEHVNQTEKIKPGALVVTAGNSYSDVYPSGIPIGIVTRTEVLPGENEQMIYLRPVTALTKIDHAFVLLSYPNPEEESLEQTTLERFGDE